MRTPVRKPQSALKNLLQKMYSRSQPDYTGLGRMSALHVLS